jgi:hypothetical protein
VLTRSLTTKQAARISALGVDAGDGVTTANNVIAIGAFGADVSNTCFIGNIRDTGRPEFGLIAEEVAKVNPDLVVRDDKGEIYTVRYDAVNAMLLNEFFKEHRRNEEQEARIARQQKQIDALTAGLQKVSAQLEASKPAPQMVNNP